MRRNQRGRRVSESRSRALDLKRDELRPRSREPDESLAGVAIAEARALFRLAVAALVVMGVTGHRMRRTGPRVCAMRRSAVHARALHRYVDRQPAVHDARMQLRRLGQTDGEPDRHEAGEATEESSATHDTNI